MLVIFKGNLVLKQLFSSLRCSHIFVHTSLAHGFGSNVCVILDPCVTGILA